MLLLPIDTPVALPTALLPSVDYLALLMRHPDVVVYVGERYEKQTFRNRCEVASPSGRESCSVPVERYPRPSPPTCAIRVTEHGGWRERLFRALLSYYGKAPYWSFLEEEVRRLVDYTGDGSLVDYNRHWLAWMCDLWELPLPIQVMRLESERHFFGSVCDRRPQPQLGEVRYWQVFEERNGFLPHLSAIDLLLNTGLEGRLYLREMGGLR